MWRLAPVQLASHDILFDLFVIHLGILTGERVVLRHKKVQSAAQRPDISLLIDSFRVNDQLWCREVKMACEKFGAQQLLEVVRHADEIPLGDAVLQMNARRV